MRVYKQTERRNRNELDTDTCNDSGSSLAGFQLAIIKLGYKFMCFITLLKAVAIGGAGMGVGMAFGDKIKSGIRRGVRLIRETKNAYHEGEMSVDLGANAKRIDLPIKDATEARHTSYPIPDDEEISRMKEGLALLERENGVLKRECESLRLKLEEAQGKIEVLFPKLVKRLYLMFERPEIKAVLEENGLSLYTDFSNFSDGFMRIKNESVTRATLVRPALVRGDDLIEPGIVHVPINEAGAEPPIVAQSGLDATNKVGDPEEVSRGSREVRKEAKTDGATNDMNFHDDFVVG